MAGPENRLAVHALCPLLDGQHGPYNPIVLFGPAASGKSHLAHGLPKHFPAPRAPMVIDDVPSLLRKRSQQNDLLRAIDTLVDTGTTVIATTQLPLPAIRNRFPALGSRLSAGLCIRLAYPGPDARLELIRLLAAQQGIELSDRAARQLAHAASGPVPDLYRLLAQFAEFSRSASAPTPYDSAETFLAQRTEKMEPGLKNIAALTADYFSLKPSLLRSHSRKQTVAMARAVAIYLARTHLRAGMQQIGHYFGGRDHSTILYNYRRIDRLLGKDPAIRTAIAKLSKALVA